MRFHKNVYVPIYTGKYTGKKNEESQKETKCDQWGDLINLIMSLERLSRYKQEWFDCSKCEFANDRTVICRKHRKMWGLLHKLELPFDGILFNFKVIPDCNEKVNLKTFYLLKEMLPLNRIARAMGLRFNLFHYYQMQLLQKMIEHDQFRMVLPRGGCKW